MHVYRVRHPGPSQRPFYRPHRSRSAAKPVFYDAGTPLRESETLGHAGRLVLIQRPGIRCRVERATLTAIPVGMGPKGPTIGSSTWTYRARRLPSFSASPSCRSGRGWVSWRRVHLSVHCSRSTRGPNSATIWGIASAKQAIRRWFSSRGPSKCKPSSSLPTRERSHTS